MYKREYDELQKIGTGGFGAVFKVVNKLDQNIYAIKKIKLSIKNEELNRKTIKEVTFLAKLQHPSIVRYYFAWKEYVSKEDLSGFITNSESETE